MSICIYLFNLFLIITFHNLCIQCLFTFLVTSMSPPVRGLQEECRLPWMIADLQIIFFKRFRGYGWHVLEDHMLFLLFFFLLKWHKERCELLIFLSFINIPLKSFLPLISFRVLSACPLWDFLLIYLLAHFFVLYICLVYLPLHLSCMTFWRRSVPTRWVLLDKGGNSCQVTSTIQERKWWMVNHYARLHVVCFRTFWIGVVGKNCW